MTTKQAQQFQDAVMNTLARKIKARIDEGSLKSMEDLQIYLIGVIAATEPNKDENH
jgi:hypothetical protein